MFVLYKIMKKDIIWKWKQNKMIIDFVKMRLRYKLDVKNENILDFFCMWSNFGFYSFLILKIHQKKIFSLNLYFSNFYFYYKI